MNALLEWQLVMSMLPATT